MFNHSLNRITGLTSLFVLALYWTSAVHSAPGNIVNSPLFANSNVAPNIFFEMDDSGSMDWEVLAISHWSNCAYDLDAYRDTGDGDCGSLRSDGLFRLRPDTDGAENFEYLYDNGDDAYTNFCDDDDNDDGRRETLYLCNANVQNSDWRIRSSAANVLYYNPDETYNPWSGGNSVMPNASFTAARSDPESTASGYSETINLETFNGGFIYEVWDTADTHSFDQNDGRPRRGSNLNRRAKGHNDYVPGFVDLWDEHTRYTVTNSILVQRISYLPDGDGHLNETVTTIATLTGSDTLDGKTIAEVQQNIANWYQYRRRRSFVAKAALGSVVTRNPDFHYGLSVINNSGTLFTEVPAVNITDFTTHNNGLLNDLYSYNWPARGTPLRLGLENSGEYFSGNLTGKTDPIQYECQQNFTVLFTDGFWNGNPPTTVTKDVDGDGINDGDDDDVTLADVARYYYINDLSTLPNRVPPNKDDSATYQHMVTFGIAFGVKGALADNDSNGWPEDAADPTINRAVNTSWGNPFNGSPQKIDDLWHAAYNSSGKFVSAATPTEVTESLNRALGSVGDRLGSGASVSFNTTNLSTDTHVFIAKFKKNTNQWSGDLVSYKVDSATGNLETEDDPTDTSDSPRQILKPAWHAAEVLDNRANPKNSRAIITYDKTLEIDGNVGNGIPFRWASLTPNQRKDLKTNPDGSIGAGAQGRKKAKARLKFLRGDRSNEIVQKGTYAFRDRSKLLGDIIHSAPLFVKKPNQSWPEVSPFPSSTNHKYSDFQTTHDTRDGVIYVGANDGMLHGFSEANGTEVLSYIPSYLFSSASASEGLHFLTDPDYLHRYYVDLSPIVSDAYFDKGDGAADWYSVLIGGSRAGGRGIFALDVTDPSQYYESSAHNIALWEFSNADDPDLGLTFSTPTIVMMNNDRWAAVFGNGYNNKGDGKAKLFILFLDGGIDGVWTDGTSGSDLDYVEIDTGVGSIVGGDCLNASSDCNGLSTPELVDLDGDYKIDRIYAGDIKGNMWAFEVDKPNWGVAYKDGNTPKPLFIATSNQPIMDKPTIIKHPKIADSSSNGKNLMVFFGTGQYLVDGDVSTTPAIQSFYGIWDHNKKEIVAADLFEQRFDTTSTFTDVDGNDVTSSIRVFTEYDDDSDGTPDAIDYNTHDGWKINFNISSSTGERIIVDPVVHDELVFFNTWIPDSTPCKSGGTGFLMSVEQYNGGTPDLKDPAFDLNGDDVIDSDDLVTYVDADGNDKDAAPIGEKFKLGLPANSKIINTTNNDKSRQYTPGSKGNGVHKRLVRGGGGGGGCATPPCAGPSLPVGRISWQELR